MNMYTSLKDSGIILYSEIFIYTFTFYATSSKICVSHFKLNDYQNKLNKP